VATRRRSSRATVYGTLTDLQRRVKYLQTKPTPSRLANQVVTRATIQPRAVDTDQIALDAITNDQIEADAIRQEQLANLSVGNPELQDNAVLNRNISRDAVNEASIEINAVGNAEMQDDSIGSAELQDNSVGSAELATDSVGSSEIALDAVGQGELATNAVGSAELQDNAVTTVKINGRAVTGDKIGLNTIQKNNISPDAVGASELDNSAVTTPKMADSAVTTAKIGNLQVTGAKIANGTIDFAKMNATAPGEIVERGLISGSGLTSSAAGNGRRLDINFGTGSGQAARGNHGHTLQINAALSGANRHIHSGNAIGSSVSVKKNITPYSPQNIKNLLNLEPKQYKYKRSNRGYQETANREWMHGYLLEELVALGFSEPVSYDKKGRPEKLDYGLMSMLVLELVKVQQTEIDSLKEEVTRLKDAK
jgi:hypothetical protein